MKFSHDVIIKPIVTEKSMRDVGIKKYVFKVARSATKHTVKSAIEDCFGVKVLSVHIINVVGRFKRQGRTGGYTSAWKKAIVTLTASSKAIEYFESVV